MEVSDNPSKENMRMNSSSVYERMPTKKQVKRFAKFFGKDENELLISFFSDKLVYEVRDEEVALKAMQVAEKKINYIIKNKNGK